MKLILIISAKSDIALETAKIYAKNKWNLILTVRKIDEDISNFKYYLESKYNSNVYLTELDILKFNTHLSFFDSLDIKPDGIICFTGYLGSQSKSETDFTQAQKIINTNFTGVVSIFNIFANYYSKKESGFLIAISSIAGERGRKKNYTYGSSKAALTQYLSGLRNRLNDKNILVSTILPGFVKTKMTRNLNFPKILTAKPKYVAKKIYLSHQRKVEMVYIPFFWYPIMVLIKLIPEKIFKKLNL